LAPFATDCFLVQILRDFADFTVIVPQLYSSFKVELKGSFTFDVVLFKNDFNES
jgi:hypothetical protein